MKDIRSNMPDARRKLFTSVCWKSLLLFLMFNVQFSMFNELRAQDAFYIYRNDGDFNGFFFDEVVRMGYSMIDLDSIEHDVYVVQEIELADTTYRIPLAVIDSIGFQQPEIRLNPSVKFIGRCGLMPYVESGNDGFVQFYNVPNNLKPQVGDVLIGLPNDEIGDGVSFYGQDGKGFSCVVESIETDKSDNKRIYARGHEVDKISDVFDQYITVEELTVDPQGSMSRRIAGLNPDGTLPQATTGHGEANILDFTSTLQREWQPGGDSKITLAAEVGVKYRMRVAYNISWTRLFIKMTHELRIETTPSLDMSVSKGFDLELSDICKLPKILFPANCPIFETDPIPTWFVRGEGKMEAKVTFPKMQLGIGGDAIIDTDKLFPIAYDMYWLPKEDSGAENPIDIGSTDVTFSGYLQTGIKFGANISTASWFKKILYGDISLDLYAGPKIDGKLEFKTDWLNNEGFNVYDMLNQINLNITGISLDLEASAEAGTFWKDPVKKTFFSTSLPLLCDTLRLVPAVKSLKAEVHGDDVVVTLNTGNDKVFSYCEMQVGIYKDGYIEGEEPVKVVGDWVYRRKDSPYTTSFPVSDLKAGTYTVRALIEWAGHGPYKAGSTRLEIPITFSAETDTLIFGSVGDELVRSVKFKTNTVKENIYIYKGKLKVIDEKKGSYEAVFTADSVYSFFPIREVPIPKSPTNSMAITVGGKIIHGIGYSQGTILPTNLVADFSARFHDGNKEYGTINTSSSSAGVIPITVVRESDIRVHIQGTKDYSNSGSNGYYMGVRKEIELTVDKSPEGSKIVEGRLYVYEQVKNNDKLSYVKTQEYTLEPAIPTHADNYPYWGWDNRYSQLKTGKHVVTDYSSNSPEVTSATYQAGDTGYGLYGITIKIP